jgi:hypothetical protein
MTAAGVLAAVLVALSAGVASADLYDPVTGEELAGNIETLDPTAEIDDADALAPDDVAADGLVDPAASDGAVVRAAKCTIQNPLFHRIVRTTGIVVTTPSGNVTLVCHAQVNLKLVRFAPDHAIVVDDGPCFLGKRRFADSHLVITPSLHVHLVCHIHPSGA